MPSHDDSGHRRTDARVDEGAALDGRIVFFGHPFDPDEREPAIRRKLESLDRRLNVPDVYESVMTRVRDSLPPGSFSELGPLPVPSWLTPEPTAADRDRIIVEGSVSFIDGDGCRGAAEQVRAVVEERVLPGVPAMIGVDHSATGGVLAGLARAYGGENVAVVVLDNHTDALTTGEMSGAIAYDLDTNPGSVYDPDDPFLFGRPDSYNASSFLQCLLAEGTIPARNLFLVGVADYPPSRAFKIRDPRIERYVGAFAALRKRGVTILTRDEVAANPARVGWALREARASAAYVSVDLDVGANAATSAVRFKERKGLDEATIVRVVETIVRDLLTRSRLVGFDVMEFDPRAEAASGGAEGSSFRLAARALTLLARAVPVSADGQSTVSAGRPAAQR